MPNENVIADPDAPIRRNEDLLCGRLVAMPTSHSMTDLENVRKQRGLKDIISIDFPAMPDTIELARTTDYWVNPNLVMPDGIHQYKATKPLEIPISFKLHAMDQQYCKQGALTLLQLAARLHSFVLPISTFRGAYTIAPKAPNPTPTSGRSDSALNESNANVEQQQQFEVANATNTRTGAIYPPVTCWLYLMWTANDQPGISCIGYVREVKVQFNGPWMRGPNKSFNLPTSADFSFVFIHRPGHTNNLAVQADSAFPSINAASSQAFADDVRKNLYNTRHLIAAFEYQGFNSSVPDQAVPEPEPTPTTEPAPAPTPQNQTPIPANDPQIYQPIT
jgi:hypothetical protein